MRTDHMNEGEEIRLKSLAILLREDLTNVSRMLNTLIEIIRPIRDRNRVGTYERANLEAQEIIFENLLGEVELFIDATSHLEGS